MKITVQDVIDQLTAPAGTLESAVDTLRSGDPNQQVTGIVTTFVASQHVIEQALSLGTNLIITHEGTYYSHQDHTDWLEHSSVYRAKRRLIEESGLAIYRFHDFIHHYQPDGIMQGLLAELGWEPYVTEHQRAASILTLPPTTVRETADYVKKQLKLPYVRLVGELSMSCSRVGVVAGYRGGGRLVIPLFEHEGLDLVIAGEGPEWETPEYVRDAVRQGRQKALILLGHAQSEEPGMKHLAGVLAKLFPGIPVHFISEEPLFNVIG
ncbi:Nif3-like dinuclear metal center hexameric protein [Paenibacillus puerhi]|uniref:Nif3-like dinuclear metal center hexameric protein n=1 Tax=Paenibacillus puerhi TaxID=2692622 RepID=UPI001357404D|nr:Nif3-like dinuclear metal center hexameric protein [Paenibacillus puerhi]